jgi:hypothetical protein
MNREKLTNERFFRIHFNDCELIIDINDDNIWQDILNRKENIIAIETLEWSWNLKSSEVKFH